MDKRHNLEMEFHDQREADRKKLSKDQFEKKYPNKRLYKISSNTSMYIQRLLARSIKKDHKFLDYCCGTGETAKEAAAFTKNVYAIDISPKSVSSALENVRNVIPDIDRSNFRPMNAESTEFENEYFDDSFLQFHAISEI